MTNIVEIKGLNKDYALTKKNPEPDAFAVKDISFNVPKGYIMGFIGPNGAGKTTVIKLLLQIKKKDAGSVTVFGKEEMQNDDIGVVMDLPNFPGEWTLTQVEKALSPFYKSWDKERFAKTLKKFDLTTKKTVCELSRGMQVKLQIAIALSHNARLLILDEPTSGLDPVARDEVCELLQEFVEDGERSVLFSTHITSDLEKIADYVTMILGGEIKFSGTKDSLLDDYTRVTGGVTDIDESHKNLVIGYRKHNAGFEGIIETVNKSKMPASVLMESPNMEEVIVFMNRGAKDA